MMDLETLALSASFCCVNPLFLRYSLSLLTPPIVSPPPFFFQEKV
nr:MAG TPA: MerT mercuric transport protein [Caudoviricetes sp.]